MIEEFEKLMREAIRDLRKMDERQFALIREGLFYPDDEESGDVDEVAARWDALSDTLDRCQEMLIQFMRDSIARDERERARIKLEIERNKREIAVLEALREPIDEAGTTSTALN